MKLRINRKTWLRGGRSDSFLYRSGDGKKCCLGFYCQAIKIPLKEMDYILSPSGLVINENRKLKLKSLVRDGFDNKVCNKLMDFNDREELSEKKRKEKIKFWFKKIGVQVEFFN